MVRKKAKAEGKTGNGGSQENQPIPQVSTSATNKPKKKQVCCIQNKIEGI